MVNGLQSNTLTLVWPEVEPMAAPIVALGRRCLSFDPAQRPTAREALTELISIESAIRTELVIGLQAAAAATGDRKAGGYCGPDSNSMSGGSNSATTTQEAQLVGVMAPGVPQPGVQGQVAAAAAAGLQQRVLHATRQQIQQQLQYHTHNQLSYQQMQVQQQPQQMQQPPQQHVQYVQQGLQLPQQQLQQQLQQVPPTMPQQQPQLQPQIAQAATSLAPGVPAAGSGSGGAAAPLQYAF